MLEVPHSPAEATVGEEEYFDLSLESLESNCKRMWLNLSYESIESEELPNSELALENLRHEGPTDSPESPDGSLSLEIFVVEQADHKESTTSSRVLECLEQVRQEVSSSYFVTPPGTPRKINFLPAIPLNDLGEPRKPDETTAFRSGSPTFTFLPRQPGRGAFPRGVALSQPAPGLGCCCKRIGIGRGHGSTLRFPRWYFGY